jgi:hypothetical protein
VDGSASSAVAGLVLVLPKTSFVWLRAAS